MDDNAIGTGRTLEEFREKMREVARLQDRRANLTASASAQRRRVTATVNADGILIDLKFSSDIDDLEYSEVAAAVTEASRLAVAEVGRKVTALYAPLRTDLDQAPNGQAPDIDGIMRTITELRDQV